MIFYPKFYCKLNFIELYFFLFSLYIFSQLDLTFGKFYFGVKYYSHKKCKYNRKSLYKTLTKTLDSVKIFAIFHYYQQCIGIMDVYRSKLEYKTKKFTEVICCDYK